MGNTYLKEQNLKLSDLYSSTGVEARIFVPALRVPFRLIFAYNNRLIYPGDSQCRFPVRHRDNVLTFRRKRI